VLDATAATTGIPLDTIFYDGETSTPNNRRRLTTSWTITSRTRVEIPLSSTSYATPEFLYSSLTSLLDTAVTSGAYSERLRASAAASNSTELLSADLSSLSYSEVSVDALQESDDDSETVIFASVFSAVAVVILGMGLWLYLRYYRHQVPGNNLGKVVCAPDDGAEEVDLEMVDSQLRKGRGSAKEAPGRYDADPEEDEEDDKLDEGEDSEEEQPASPLKMPVGLQPQKIDMFVEEA